MSKVLSFVLLIVASLLAPVQGSGADVDDDIPPPEKSAGVDLRDPQVIEKGMEMINSTCGGYCHGTAGRGYKGPPLRNRTDLSTDSMIATIKYGRKRAGRLMPAWNGTLSEAEMWTAIAAIVSLRHVDSDASGAKPATH